MCGIAGFINGGDEAILKRMARRIVHRGPDDEGLFFQKSSNSVVGLASRRLSILDLSPAGHMPMTTADGRYTIAYNGEVYNYPELKSYLSARGYTFRSGSDTEAVLYLYQEHGPACAERLNGMFAFAVWDAHKEELFLARDHFGIKPLYYFHQGEKVLFGSEIKSILEAPGVRREVNPEALHQYLTLLWVPDPLTMFAGIMKLPAGHSAIFRRGEMKISEFWDLKLPNREHTFRKTEAQLLPELQERWNNVVKSQLLSDVPLGAFLSAGIDSSSIVASMRAGGVASPRTFTISFPETARVGEISLDDTSVAARTAEALGCVHQNIVVEPNVVELLPKLAWHMDEPVSDPAIIMAYLVNREARKSVTVLLSGVGGDELFAGYRKYQAHYLALNYQRIPKPLRTYLIEPAIKALPAFRGSSLKGYLRLAKKMARSGSLPPAERFLMDSVYLLEAQKQQLYSEGFRSSTNGFDPFSAHRKHLAKVSHADFLNQMLYLDLKTFTVSLNLTYNDKMSMASSVEVRVPFLDSQFASWAFEEIPPGLKLNHGVPKYILREAMKPIVPEEVFRQRKAGFGAPIDHWLVHDLREMTDDLLCESQIRQRGLFDPHAVRSLVNEHRSGRQDWSMQIWQFITLELWFRQFIDQPPS